MIQTIVINNAACQCGILTYPSSFPFHFVPFKLSTYVQKRQKMPDIFQEKLPEASGLTADG